VGKYGALVVMFMLFMGGCARSTIMLDGDTRSIPSTGAIVTPPPQWDETYTGLKARIVQEYNERMPQEWGQALRGVMTGFTTAEQVMALTFDACGGSYGSEYDAELIRFLELEQVPATLFMNARWIDSHVDIFLELSRNPLFEIENHGLMHKPCSVTGRAAYGIAGTAGVAELVDEIELNARKIEHLTGRKPFFYRPGTAFCDEIGVQIVHALGYEVAGYSVLGDAGATYKRDQVRDALLTAPPGAIVLLHMNHPSSGTRDGVMQAIPLLKQRGVRFVRLGEGCLPSMPTAVGGG
jgi:peptidoglycan/xylan/chitin deacetylase (PgdA/CDA1 family)